MSNTLTKKGFRGFTLIELLVVISIIGLLSTIIAAPIQNARKKAKDVKKIAEMKEVQTALEQYAEANNGNYPASLSLLSPQFMPLLPSYAGTGVPARDRFAYITYTGTPNGSTVTQVFGYHLAVKMDVNNTSLDNDRDCTGAVAGVTITSPACVAFNATAAPTINFTNYASGMPCGDGSTPAAGVTPTAGTCTATTDLGLLTEGATSTCTNVNDCVYDVTNQQ